MSSTNKYDKTNGQNAGGGDTSEGKIQEQKAAVNEILNMATNTDWENQSSTRKLKEKIKSNKLFGAQGEMFISQLILNENPKLKEREESLWKELDNEPRRTIIGPERQDFRGIGKQLLRWMLKDTEFSKSFTRAPAGGWRVERRFEKKPIHLAIEEYNLHFLACFLGVCYDPDLEDLRPKSRNYVHHAIDYEVPFATFLVAVCPIKALKESDGRGHTPMLTALKRVKTGVESIPERPRSIKDDPHAPCWDNVFSPLRVVQEIVKRNDDPNEKLIETLLITTTNDGTSPFQFFHENCKENESKKNPSEQEVLKNKENRQLLDLLKQLIFDNVRKISNVSTALYGNGTKSDVKELCLDMSDFNQSSHNFETFVDKLKQLDSENEAAIEFEDTLFFVTLPDLNYVKQPCPHHATRRLFEWLRRKKVGKIKKLSIPDNTTNPLSEAFVQQYIIDVFNIEELDWRKLDINLDVITGTEERRRLAVMGKKPTSDTWKCLKKLTLYSSGNWSALYHWISEDGLAKLPALKTVRINIVHLNQAEGFYDEATHERHLDLANEYKARLERMRSADKQSTYKLEVKSNTIWDYPVPPHQPDEPTTQILKHQFTSQLLPSLNALREWGRRENSSNDDNGSDEEHSGNSLDQMRTRFQRFALKPQRNPSRSSPIDRRIRVAIIDNGADRIRPKFRHMIAKGQSYVKADLLGSDRSLPWWMVSDPHGTQMASLISQTNGYCQLYIARVGKGRTDIDPADAAKAITWAVEQKVDIISISWTLKQEDAGLRTVIEKAASSTLIFCSTPDQGVYSEAWPVAYKEHVLSVSATDSFGHMTSKTRGTDKVDIQIPGENVSAAGPAYIGNLNDTVSGSSVATALAAGIASLALLLLRTFNPELGVAGLDEGDREEMKEFYTKKGILRVFQKMDAESGALKLSKLFPDEALDESKTLEKLAQNWNVDNFCELT